MKTWQILLPVISCLCLLLTACGKPSDGQDGTTSNTTRTAPVIRADEMFTDRDQRDTYEESTAAHITLNGTSATATSDAVTISGSTVTITDEGTYILTGTLTDGRIVVDTDDKDKPQLVLNGVSVTSSDSAALYILNADKVVVTLASGTENALVNGGSFVITDENNVDGTVFSKQDLTFNGKGSLTVTSPSGHGIVCKDDLVFTGGTYTVTAASHGVDANDSIRLSGGTVTVDAGKDGFHAENTDDDTLGFVYMADGTYTVEAEGDGISGGAYVQIDGGTVDIISGGGYVNAEKETSDNWGGFGGMGGGPGGGMRPGGYGRSAETDTTTTEDSTSIKGIKAAGNVVLNGGTVTVDSADDAIHSNGSITVAGGNFSLKTGDDGFHADDTLTINGGTIAIDTCYEGLEALHVTVSGGNIRLKADDDGINAAGGTDNSGAGGMRPGGDRFGGMGGGSSSGGSIMVSGGDLYIHSSGDGLDANGTLTISGGHTIVVGPTQGDTATLDYDVSGVITGGTFIGTGASGMAQTFSDSKQGVIAVSVGNQAAGTKITVTDKNGNELLSHEPELSFAVVILSSSEMKKGETYTIRVGDLSDTFEAE
ncbi:MAG: carbohydrate-binding domain-containing protein [Clostridia bacterium]|nr:carbohydrate-binding domain-containing protein [Clostridia bacterium]